jgi:hypothetical protein
MILQLLTILSTSFLDDLYNEMSMDTYPYGVDPSPVVRTVNGQAPTIDSLGNDCLYGHIKDKHFIWTRDGKTEDSQYDLKFNELFFDYPRKP